MTKGFHNRIHTLKCVNKVPTLLYTLQLFQLTKYICTYKVAKHFIVLCVLLVG